MFFQDVESGHKYSLLLNKKQNSVEEFLSTVFIYSLHQVGVFPAIIEEFW